MLRLVLNSVTGVMHRRDMTRLQDSPPVTTCGCHVTGWTGFTVNDDGAVVKVAAREGARVCERCFPPPERRGSTRPDDVAVATQPHYRRVTREDRIDAEVAQARLDEIDGRPKRLISGRKLRVRLDELLA